MALKVRYDWHTVLLNLNDVKQGAVNKTCIRQQFSYQGVIISTLIRKFKSFVCVLHEKSKFKEAHKIHPQNISSIITVIKTSVLLNHGSAWKCICMDKKLCTENVQEHNELDFL